MPITVNYEPYSEIGKLATQSGEAQASQRQQTIGAQMAMQKAQNQAQLASQQYQAEVQMQIEKARMDFQSKINAQKLQVAGQIEIQEFQRKQMKLSSLLTQIDEANYVTPEQKEEMKLQAYSKYADASLDSSFFKAQKPTTYEEAKDKIDTYNKLIAEGVAPQIAAGAVGLKAGDIPKTKMETLLENFNNIKSDMGLFADKEGNILDQEGYDINEAQAQKIQKEIAIEKLNIDYEKVAPEKIIENIKSDNPEVIKQYKKVLNSLRKEKLPEETVKAMLIESIVENASASKSGKKFKAGSLLFGGIGAAYGLYDYLRQ